MKSSVIHLTVNNHAGVMSHITGLFSRRGYNLEGIICGRTGDGSTSQMYLLVNEDERLVQIVKQINKLYDIIEIDVRHDISPEVFDTVSCHIEQIKIDSPECKG